MLLLAVALLCTLAPSAFAGTIGSVRGLGNAARGGGAAAVPAVAITAPVPRVRFEARPEVKVKLVPKPVIGYVTEPVASVAHGFKPVLTIAAGVPVSLVDGSIGPRISAGSAVCPLKETPGVKADRSPRRHD
ncbi:hypothetical protein MTO96_016638 [Rhipicephalus appendiculatus]